MGVKVIDVVIMNFDREGINMYDELVASLKGVDFPFRQPKKLNLDLMNQETLAGKSFINKHMKLEINDLPSHLFYVFFGKNSTSPVISADDFNEGQLRR